MYPDPTGPKIGDPIPNFGLPDTTGTLCIGRTPEVAGRLAAILFVGDPSAPAARNEIARCKDVAAAFTAAGARLFVVTTAGPDANKTVATPSQDWRLLGDTEGSAAIDFGVGKSDDRRLPVCFVVDPNSYVVAIISGGDGLASRALAEIQRPAHHPVAQVVRHIAPVLHIQRVFEPAFCDQLISTWAEDSRETGTDNIAGAAPGYEVFKRRRDHVVRDADLQAKIQRRLALRVLPEIEKVFFFKVTRQEAMRIGRYDADRRCFFKPHRDNVPPNTHRRFALTLTLNEGYEGGSLRFPEYGPHEYRPGTGEAIIFPCSLIHEVTPVTRGDRFALISFFFGEAEYQTRQAQRSQAG